MRYLTGDPPDAAARAASILDGAETAILPDIVLLETAHVLRSVYGVPREALFGALGDLVRRRNVQVLDRPKALVDAAFARCIPSGRTSIADALFWAAARTSGLPVATFDRRFPGEDIDVRLVEMSGGWPMRGELEPSIDAIAHRSPSE